MTFQIILLQVEGSQELRPDDRRPQTTPGHREAAVITAAATWCGSEFAPDVTSPGIRLSVGEDEEGRTSDPGW